MVIKNGVLSKDFENESNNRFIKRIRIPNNVTEIAADTFRREAQLKSVKFPMNLKIIGKNAFNRCLSLKSVNLPNSVEKIDDDAFSMCFDLKKVKLPKNLTEINSGVFNNCSGLKKIKIPESVKSINKNAFTKTESLEKINLPENLEYLGESVFEQSAIKNISIPKAVSSIPKNAFANCENLRTVELPKNLQNIDEGAFQECTKLKKVEIPENVKNIGKNAFKNCYLLNEIQLPKKLNKISEGMFLNCELLQEVSIPDSVKYIGDYAFENCKVLWWINLPSSLKSIGEAAFKGSRIEKINIPSNVKIIHKETFAKTEKLQEINIHDNVKFIEESAFEDSGIQKARLPKSLKIIKRRTFAKCYDLEKVEMPEDTEVIEHSAFYHCDRLESITLPNTLTRIGEKAFKACSSLQNIVLPKNITEIENSTFENCSSLKNIELTDNITRIGESAFNGCNSLNEINLPESISTIEEHAFANCASLTNIKLPSTIKTIADKTFCYCPSLKEIVIPDGVENIGESAFEGCLQLENIIIPESVKTIGNDAFSSCLSLKELFIPSSVTDFSAINSLIQENQGKYKSLKYLSKTDKGFYLTSEPTSNYINLNDININLEILGRNWKYYDLIMNEQKNSFVAKFYNRFLNHIAEESPEIVDNFIKNHNFTFYKKFKEFDDGNFNFNFYKCLFNLGAFEKPIKVNNKTVDYAQKITNFLIEKLHSNKLSILRLVTLSKDMEHYQFKPEFTDFFMERFDELMSTERQLPGFISRCYDEFEIVQKANTSHRGSQRQLKPTVQKFVDYFNNSKFMYVTEETQEIAHTISPYYNDQEAFNNAIKIFEEYKLQNVPTSITRKKVIDPNSPFVNIDKYENNIKDLQKDTLKNLTETATNEFTFEWLDKNDPNNLILGKLCSCCAHLEGAGYGIMRASIIHPDIQNMVIRNSSGEIIAKATLYVNRRQGYGVFNAIEVNESINKNYGIFRTSESEETNSDFDNIYNTIINGVNAFANQYNIEHPSNKLKVITVGSHHNKFLNTIKRYANKQQKILKAVNFSDYGRDGFDYEGDWDVEQYILWKNNNLEAEKESSEASQSKE